MATRYTLTGNLPGLIGADPDTLVVTISTNLDGALTTDDGETIPPGEQLVPLSSTGTFAVNPPATNSTGLNVTDGSLRYVIRARKRDASGKRIEWSSGFFTLTGPADLSAKVGTATGPIYDALAAEVTALAEAAVAAEVDAQVPGLVSDSGKRTENFPTTNLSLTSSTGDVPGVTATIVGNGRPVEVTAYAPFVYHSAVALVQGAITVNGAHDNAVGSQLGGVVSYTSGLGGPIFVRRITDPLTVGQTYVFGLRIASTAAGTATLIGLPAAPIQIDAISR